MKNRQIKKKLSWNWNRCKFLLQSRRKMVVCNKRYPYDSARAAKQLSARVQSKPQLFSDELVELYDIDLQNCST